VTEPTPTVAVATPTTPPPTPSSGFPEQPDDVPWPTEEWAEADLPAGIDPAVINAATEIAFADGAQDRVRAVVVVHRGAIVYERYSPNSADGPDVVMPSHSMAKSVVSAMTGILVRDGLLDIYEPAPVPEWQEDPADPRAAITIEQMLHMSSGMAWTDNYREPGTNMYEMVRESDMAAYAVAQQLSWAPGEMFDYNSGTSMLLARILGQRVGGDPDDVRAFLENELFHRIGMDPVRIGFDDVGTWQGAFAADSTARNFARFGLLYTRGGEWDGEQILSREWVEFSRTPSPANPEYGAHWWLDVDRRGVSYAIGAAGQVITVDPGHDLVIVQLSTVGGNLPLNQTEVILKAFAELDAR
jgi:CubicO group peptidase (beta-lactamase class C family)